MRATTTDLSRGLAIWNDGAEVPTRVGGQVLSRVEGTNQMATLPVLTPAVSVQVADEVLELREHWTPRSARKTFFTLGANAYMDLAQAMDPAAGYDVPAQRKNLVLTERFSWLYATLAEKLQDALALPVRYAEDLALPGFHIWTAEGIPRRAGGALHFDLQYLRLLERPDYAGATGTVSFTLPLRLPAAGSNLRVWPDITYPAGSDQLEVAREVEPLIVPYASVGEALVHTGHILHQIGITPSVRPDDVRITLQGHGLIVGGVVVLYW